MNLPAPLSKVPEWRNGALACLLLPRLAAAAALPFHGKQDKLCVGGVVVKNKLAAFLIDKYPLSMQVYSAHPELAPADPLRKTLGALIHDKKACSEKCGSDDQANASSFPLEISNSYVGLASAGGNPAVSHFKHSLTYSLHPKGFVGLSLNYEHGRREDTLKYVRLWELALSVHY